jgi:DNA-binding CsgD family transcriptional regulator/pimeloyl-ACP methyl ester carboxylesterase
MEAPPVQYAKTADGVSIAYARAGAGLPLVFVSIVWSHFSLQWSTGIRSSEFVALAERFELFLYDGRGSGLSQRGIPSDLPLSALDADLDAVASLVQAPKFLLFSTSPHGLVAIRYASHRPERVAGMVLWNYIDTKVASFAAGNRVMAETDWETHLVSQAITSFPQSETSLVARVLREALAQQELLAITRALRSESAEALLADLKVPVLVLASRAGHRPRPTEAAARWLTSQIPGAQLQLFEGPSGGLSAPPGEVPPAVLAIEQFAATLTASPEPSPATRDDGLSSRELEVLRLMAAGRSNAQIAEALVISPNTVARHVSNIFDKTGAANRTEATAYAHRQGLV